MYYYRGQPIQVGDIVRTGSQRKGIIEQVIAPGSADAADLGCPSGGLLIKEDWDGVPSRVLVIPYTPDWEDLEIISQEKKGEGEERAEGRPG